MRPRAAAGGLHNGRVVSDAEFAASEVQTPRRGMSRRDIAIVLALVLLAVAIALVFASFAGAADPMTRT